MEQTPASNRALVVTAAVIAVVVALGAFIWLYPPAHKVAWSVVGPAVTNSQTFIAAATLPQELRAAAIITDSGAYRAGSMGFAPASEKAVDPIVQQVYDLDFNMQTEKANGVASDDGERVAFQTLLDSNATTSISSWQVSMTGVKNGDQYVVGKGVMPFFIDPSHVAWVSPTGVMVGSFPAPNSTTSPAVSTLLAHSFDDNRVSVAPGRALVAFAKEGKIEVHNVALEGTKLITTYGGEFTSFALSDEALYVLIKTEEGTHVDRFRFAEGEVSKRIHTFPASLGVTALSF